MQMSEFIGALPKAELHLHLEGAIPWSIARARNPELPARPPWWDDSFAFADFAVDFTRAIRSCYYPALRAVEDYARVAAEIFAGLAAQNVRYAEISFSPRYAYGIGLSIADAARAVKRAAPAGLAVAVYAGFSREAGFRGDDPAVQATLAAPDLDGLDLHGDERKSEAAPFAELYAAARARGLRLKAHAGELRGPASVAEALDSLGVARIEHGFTAAGDPALVERLVAERITLDLCPISNVKLGLLPALAAHPIRALYQRGVRVTVSSDDPTVFGCTLTSELHALVEHLGFSPADLARLQVNAFSVAKLPPDARAAICAEIEDLVAQATVDVRR